MFPVFAAENNIPSGDEIKRHIAEYETHHSFNYSSSLFIEVHQNGLRFAGFGAFHVREMMDQDSCGMKGYDCYWTVISGRKIIPSITDSIVVNGITGIKDHDGWVFEVATGSIHAYSREPYGKLIRASLEGKDFPLEKSWDRKKFREHLKSIPEAYLAWNNEPLGSIRIFNLSGKAERVTNTDYNEGSGQTPMPGEIPVLDAHNSKRLSLNANDLIALGRKVEFHCGQHEYEQARVYLDKLVQFKPGYYRIPLLEAYCADRRGSVDSAKTLYDSAMRNAPEDLIPEIHAAVEKIENRHMFDNAYAHHKQDRVSFGIEFGLGFPYSMLGLGFSTQLNLGSFKMVFLTSEGFINGIEGNPVPMLGVRAYGPGRKWRFYGGIFDYNFFDAKKRSDIRIIGPEMGLAVDVGKPFGFFFHLGAGYYLNPSYESRDGNGRNPPDAVPFPFLGAEYEF